MVLNLDQTIQSTLTQSMSHTWTLAKYENKNMPTVHAQMWTNENSQERGKTYRHEKRCVLRFDLNVLRVA